MKKSINMDEFKEFDWENIKSNENLSAMMKELPTKLNSLGYSKGRTAYEFFDLCIEVMDKICKKLLIEKGLDPELRKDSNERLYFQSLNSKGKLYFES